MDWKAPKHSPLLRGGKALQQTVHQIISEQASPTHRPVCRQLLPSLLGPAHHQSPAITNHSQSMKRNESWHLEVGMKECVHNEEIMKGHLTAVHEQLEQHEKRMGEEVEGLRAAVTCYAGRVQHLEEKVAAQHTLINQVLQHTNRALQQQQLLLSTQHTLIQGVCVSGGWGDVVHAGVLVYLLRTLSLLPAHRHRRHHRHHRMLLQLLLVVQLVRLTCTADHWLGASRRITCWSMRVIRWVRNRLYKFDSQPTIGGLSGAATR